MNNIIEGKIESEEIEGFSILMKVSPDRTVEGVALKLKNQYNFGPETLSTISTAILHLHLNSVPDEGKGIFLAQFVNSFLAEVNKFFGEAEAEVEEKEESPE
jgi:hypothetical protein